MFINTRVIDDDYFDNIVELVAPDSSLISSCRSRGFNDEFLEWAPCSEDGGVVGVEWPRIGEEARDNDRKDHRLDMREPNVVVPESCESMVGGSMVDTVVPVGDKGYGFSV